MEWNESQCLKLIKLYEATTILWDSRDPDYYKMHLKEDTWERIGNEMDMPATKCRQKMGSLLASFRREKLKTVNDYGVTKGSNRTYSSRWFAYNAFRFLDNTYNSHEKHAVKHSKLENRTFQADEDNKKEDDDSNDDVLLLEPVKKKWKDSDLQILPSVVDQQAPRLPGDKNAELESFTSFILEKMKSFSTQAKNCVQQEISRILFKADQGLYENYSSHGHVNSGKTASPLTVLQCVTPSTSLCYTTFHNSTSTEVNTSHDDSI